VRTGWPALQRATENLLRRFGTFACTSPGLCVGTPIRLQRASCKTGEV